MSVGGLVAAAGWLTLVLAVTSVVGQRLWPLELVTHFWPQLLLSLLCASLVAALSGSRRSAVAQGVGGIVLLLLVAPSIRVHPSRRAEPPDLIALFINVERSNTERAKIIGTIRTVRPHVVALAEVDDAWLESLEAILDDYPYRVALPRNDNFGIALLSRLPLSRGSVEFIGKSRLPSIIAAVTVDSVPWHVVVTHPIPPLNGFAFGGRNQQLAALAEELGDVPMPTILLGDLNATLWSPYLRDFRRATGLMSASSGLRAFYTWPVGLPILALGLDHCLYSNTAAVVGYRVLRSVGSDHFPIVCAFSGSD